MELKTTLKRLRRRLIHFYRALTRLGAILVVLMIVLVIVLICGTVYLFLQIGSINKYCYINEVICPAHSYHIGCHPPNKWDEKKCGPNPIQINLNSKLKDMIVHKINTMRNLFSGHELRKRYIDYEFPANHYPRYNYRYLRDYNTTPAKPPCGRCGVIQWDDDLDYLAQLSLKFCDSDTSLCYNTTQFINVGQIVEIRTAGSYFKWIDDVLRAWMERDLIKGVFHKRTPNPKHILLLHEKQTHIGCAMALIGNDNDRQLFFNCLVSFTSDHDGYFVDRAGSRCESGVDIQYENLCSLDENIKPNFDRHISFIQEKDADKPVPFNYIDDGVILE